MITFKEFLFQSIYNADNADEKDDEQEINNLAETLAEETLDELNYFSLNEDDGDKSNSEIADELRKIMLTYGICMAYLGPARMKKISRFISTKTRTIAKGNNPKELVNLYRRILTFAKASDPTGLTKINLQFTGTQLKISGLKNLGSNSIWCENFISLARKIKQFTRSGIARLTNRFKMRKNVQFYSKALERFYNYVEDDNDAKLSDDEKAQKGITWAKQVNMSVISKMNLRVNSIDKNIANDEDESNTDNNEVDSAYLVSFFKALVKIATVYGEGANPQLFARLADFVEENQ